MRKGRVATGNNPIDITLSELDKRILGIIEHEYIQGLTGVPDSFPEEQNVSKMYKIVFLFLSHFVSAHSTHSSYMFDCIK